MSQEHGPLHVIGVGVCRTGTRTLKVALETLYGQPCYHMSELGYNHANHVKLWTKLHALVHADPDAKLPADTVRQIFKDYAASTDHPACAIYKQLMDVYPNAKLILTTRDAKSWIESVRSTVLPLHGIYRSAWFTYFIECAFFEPGFEKTFVTSLRLALGFSVDLTDDNQMMEAFENRNAAIQYSLPPERLLVFNVKEGWEPLCRFLGKPIPAEPFPHVNTRKELLQEIDHVRKKGVILLTVLVASFGLVVATAIRWFVQLT